MTFLKFEKFSPGGLETKSFVWINPAQVVALEDIGGRAVVSTAPGPIFLTATVEEVKARFENR
ncbi:MAG: hypothetical protein ACTHPD_15505 [Rhizomicrobium sp.]